MRADLEELGGVVLTQGFIARNAWGETVLLGRGGSDTSAAYFADTERLDLTGGDVGEVSGTATTREPAPGPHLRPHLPADSPTQPVKNVVCPRCHLTG